MEGDNGAGQQLREVAADGMRPTPLNVKDTDEEHDPGMEIGFEELLAHQMGNVQQVLLSGQMQILQLAARRAAELRRSEARVEQLLARNNQLKAQLSSVRVLVGGSRDTSVFDDEPMLPNMPLQAMPDVAALTGINQKGQEVPMLLPGVNPKYKKFGRVARPNDNADVVGFCQTPSPQPPIDSPQVMNVMNGAGFHDNSRAGTYARNPRLATNNPSKGSNNARQKPPLPPLPAKLPNEGLPAQMPDDRAGNNDCIHANETSFESTIALEDTQSVFMARHAAAVHALKQARPERQREPKVIGTEENHVSTSKAASDDEDEAAYSSSGDASEALQTSSRQNRARTSVVRLRSVGAPIYQPEQNPRPVFADPEEVKNMVRQAVRKDDYNVADFYCHRSCWAKLAMNQYFDYLTLSVIGFNALWMSIDTDYNHETVLNNAHVVFQIAEHSVCAYFTFEICVRYLAFQNKRHCLYDLWFIFDFVLVFMTIAETWIMSIIIACTSATNDGKLKNASLLRLLRLLRLARMARLIRLLRAVPELMILVKGMAMASRSVLLTLFLLGLIIYVFAITFTQLTDGQIHYFVDVPNSMNTLLLHGCFLEDLPDVVNESGAVNPFFGVLLVCFVLLASMTVMNMLVGVLVEVVSVVAAVEKETLQVNFVRSKLQSTLQDLDTNGDHLISRNEFESIIVQPQAARALQEVGCDVVGLIDFTDFIFEQNDNITFNEFMDTVLELRGTNGATVKDIVDLRKSMLQEFNRIDQHMFRRMVLLFRALGGYQFAHCNNEASDKELKMFMRALEDIVHSDSPKAGVYDAKRANR